MGRRAFPNAREAFPDRPGGSATGNRVDKGGRSAEPMSNSRPSDSAGSVGPGSCRVGPGGASDRGRRRGFQGPRARSTADRTTRHESSTALGGRGKFLTFQVRPRDFGPVRGRVGRRSSLRDPHARLRGDGPEGGPRPPPDGPTPEGRARPGGPLDSQGMEHSEKSTKV